MISPASRGRPAADLFAAVRALGLPSGHYAIFGSGPIAARGLLELVSDLDVLVRNEAWERVLELQQQTRPKTSPVPERAVRASPVGEGSVVDLGNGLTFGRSWLYGDFDIDQLIDEADDIEGLPFVRLEAVVEFKRIADRVKDREHLELLRAHGLLAGI